MGVEERLKLLPSKLLLLGDPVNQWVAVRSIEATVKLGTVTGGQNGRFLDTR